MGAFTSVVILCIMFLWRFLQGSSERDLQREHIIGERSQPMYLVIQ